MVVPSIIVVDLDNIGAAAQIALNAFLVVGHGE